MEQADQSQTPLAPPLRRAAAFGVHIFTALGAGVALLALLEAVREHWAAMFAWLGVALVIDAVDGPIARRLDVVRLQPNWSGDMLDLVVDFVTYVFVPAYAITASGLLLPVAAPLLGIGIAVIGRALFRRSAHEDATTIISAAFPGCGTPPRSICSCCTGRRRSSSLAIALLIVATFLPFHVLHPVRVVRLRWLTLTLMAVWAVLGLYALIARFRRRMRRSPSALCADRALCRGERRGDPAREVAQVMIELLTSPEAWAALLTLTALEIVLGIDNVIFLSVIVSRIPRAAGDSARGRSGSRWRWSSASCCSACWSG